MDKYSSFAVFIRQMKQIKQYNKSIMYFAYIFGGSFSAIARGLAKDSDFIILDEPTSALDPLAESEVYENFNQLTQGRCAIFISHRMSSSIFCDRILVLDNGRVADFDSHEKLMKKKDGLYYKMFTTQAENYQLS